MKADKDDAPAHITRNRRSPLGRAAITLIILAAAILYMADRNGWVDYAKDRFTEQPLISVRTPIDPPPTPTPSSAAAEDPFWQNAEADRRKAPAPAEPPRRQTSFNDDNYQPKRIINTMPPSPRQYTQTRPARTATQSSGLSGNNRTRLTWQDNRQNGFWWEGTYQWRDNVLKYDDLCRSARFPRKGSIEYRGCRRAAKAYLRNECRAGRNKSQELRWVYCHAEDAFRH